MEPGRWKRLRELFHAVVDLDAAGRRDYLDRHCEDAALRRRVESLVLAESGDDRWIKTPIEAAVGAAVAEQVTAGQQVGPYRLVREIGRGGMGVVYLARRTDEAYDQQVAVKLVGAGPSSGALAGRFRKERQILAHLDHPNIARLLDGGSTPAGVPYLVMDYVDGEPITEYCDRRRLSTRQRLQLFLTICSAVQYAHRNLVLHRDLKPGNILVTSEGVPKLLDFGIAKLLDESGSMPAVTLTVISGRPFTPEYASPEQVRGEPVSTASDVYSLGAVLYELLSGRRPYEFESYRQTEIERVVGESVPPKPSTVVAPRSRRRLEGDLDNIVMKALRKEPARRYASVERLVADVERHLQGLPVRARRPTLRYRASKFVRRHLTALATGLGVAAVVVAIVGFYTSRLSDERNRARLEASTAMQVSDFLAGLFEVSDPGQARGEEITARELLDRGAASIAEELAGQPEVEARMLDLVGDIYRKLGTLDRAEVLLQQALSMREQQHGRDSLPVAETLVHLGHVHLAASRNVDALPLFERALEIRRRELGPDHVLVAETLTDAARARIGLSRLEQAERSVSEALEIFDRLESPTDIRRADALEVLGGLAWQRANYAEAERHYREALEIDKAALGPDHWKVGSLLHSVAVTLQVRGLRDEAMPLYEEAIKVLEQSLGPTNTTLAWTLNAVAGLHNQEGRAAEAERLYRRVAAIYEEAVGPDSAGLGVALANLSMIFIRQARFDEAEPACQRSLAIAETNGLPRNVAFALHNLGWLRAEQGRYEAAAELLRRSVETRAEASGRDHHRLTPTLLLLGRVYRELKRVRESREAYEWALEVQETHLEPDDPELAATRTELGRLATEAGGGAR